MGPTGAGKSTCYRILSRIMTSLHKAGSKNEQYQEVAFEILNPKCITMGADSASVSERFRTSIS